MIQSISAINLFNTQQVKAFNNIQINGNMPTTLLTQASAPQFNTLNLQAMAQAINTTNNNGIVDFKGNKKELIAYLEAQVQSGDRNIKDKDYTTRVKTADGKTYEVTVGIKKENNDLAELLEGLSDDTTAYVKLKEQTNNKTYKTEELNFHYNVKTFNNDTAAKNKYAAMKQKYGAI